MALNLGMLLQGLANSSPDTQPIVVNASQDVNAQGTPPGLNGLQLGTPTDLSQDNLDVLRGLGNLPERKGMFGVKGTLRDILGTVSDALLEGSGRKAIYRPAREQERIADAMVGFNSTNPAEVRAAISRVAYQNPQLGYQLQQQHLNDILKQQQIDALTENKKALASLTAQKTRDVELKDTFRQYTAASGALAQNPNNPKLQAIHQALTQKLSGLMDISPEDLANATPEELAGLGYSGMTSSGQARDALAREKMSLQNEQFNKAEAGRMARFQPRATPKPVSTKEAIEAKVAQSGLDSLTPGQRQVWDATHAPKGRQRNVAPPTDMNNTVRTPPQQAIDELKKNPGTANLFDQAFGAGAAKKILGR